MTWSNWTTYASQVLSWVVGLFGTLFEIMMSNPLVGVPVILGIVALVFRLVVIFIGSISAGGGAGKKES